MLVLLDGCEDFSALSQSSAVIVPGRYQNGIRITSASSPLVYRPHSTQEADTVTIGFAFKATWLTSSSNLLVLLSDAGATTHNTVRLNTDGSITVLRSTSAALFTTAVGLVAQNVWYYLELQIRLHDTLGAVTLRLNGATVGSQASGDTKNAGTKTVYDTIQWNGGSGATVDLDDIYLATASTTPDAFLGNLTVETLLPDGNGAANQWTGIDGDSVDNYLFVDDPHPISVGDYVYTNTVGLQDLYALAPLVHTSGTIVGVCHSAHMIRTDPATAMNVRLVSHGAIDTKSAALALGTGYRSYDYALAVDPETGAPFTIAAVNALQSGVELA